MKAIRKNKRQGAIKKIRAKMGYGCSHEVLVFCSNRNVYAQVLDLQSGKTLFGVSTLKLNSDKKKNVKNIKYATEVGKKLADICKKEKITPAFNRAEKIFHGVVKAVADGFYGNLK